MKNTENILTNHPQVDEWRIVRQDISSTELFFIKDELQMNRAKDVSKLSVTIYKNKEIDGKKFKGSSSVNLSPSFTNEEIKSKIDQAALAANFVNNQYYDLPKPSNKTPGNLNSNFKEGNFIESIGNLVKDLYSEDNQFSAFVNSSEFFINKYLISITNSNGISVSYETYKGEIELITEAQGLVESIELFDIINFSEYDEVFIKNTIKEQLYNTFLRSQAIPLPDVGNIPVILNGKAIKQLWTYYISQASASAKYEHIHNNKLDDSIQGEDIQGDLVTLSMKPFLENSVANRFYDTDGVFLEDTVLIENGILKNYLATKRYADYIGCKTSGQLPNLYIGGGKFTEKELKTEPYLEVLSFSAFQANVMTGDFGGEFRLAIYFDGEKEIPVTLGTVSGNIKKDQKDMFLSKELVSSNDVLAPKIVKFSKMIIA